MMAEGMEERDWLREGMMVELRSDQEGYRGAWFEVTIIQLYYKKNGVCHQVGVEYREFTESEEPDSKKLQEIVKKDHLRPLPPTLPHKQWKKRDAVETLHEGAWWVGFIKHYNAKKDSYLVFYGRGQEDLDIAASDIRIRQDYVRPSGSSLQCGWNICPPMQEPADWEITKETQVARTKPRAEASSHSKRYESDDSWDEQNEYTRNKKPRLQAPTLPQA